MAFGNRITTTTQDFFLPKAIDTVLNSNVLATRVLTAAKKWRGETLKIPVIVNTHAAGSSFSGYDTLSTTASNTRVNLSFNPKFYSIPVTLPLDEISVNKNGEDKVLDVVSLAMQEAAYKMADEIGTLLYSDGTGNGSKDFLGLKAIVDDGTDAATYGGQSRTTYTTLKSTVTASSGTLTLAKMATLYNNITSGSQKPTIGLTTETVFSLYEQLLQPQQRIVTDVPMMKAGLKGGAGFTGLSFKGFPILADEKATSGVLFFVNEDYLDFFALPLAETQPVKFKMQEEGNDYSDVEGLGFSWSDWIKPSNQAALVGHIYLGGELVSGNPKRHGKLTGITSV